MDQSENEISEFQQYQEILSQFFPDIVLLRHKRDPHNIEEFAIYKAKDYKIAVYYFFRIGSVDIFIGPKWNRNNISWSNSETFNFERITSEIGEKVNWINIELLEPIRSFEWDRNLPLNESIILAVKLFADNRDQIVNEMYSLDAKAEKNYLKNKSPMQRGLFQMGKMIRKAWAAL